MSYIQLDSLPKDVAAVKLWARSRAPEKAIVVLSESSRRLWRLTRCRLPTIIGGRLGVDPAAWVPQSSPGYSRHLTRDRGPCTLACRDLGSPSEGGGTSHGTRVQDERPAVSAERFGPRMKVRVFVVDEGTGRPLAGVPLELVAKHPNGSAPSHTEGGGAKPPVETPLGVLASDRAGYVSFDAATDRLEISPEFVVRPLAQLTDERSRYDHFVRITENPLHGPLILRVPADLSTPGSQLPSVQNPDPEDWEASPSSFSIPQPSTLGEGDCAVPLPRARSSDTFRFIRVESGQGPLPAEFRPPDTSTKRHPQCLDQVRSGLHRHTDTAPSPAVGVPQMVLVREFMQNWDDLGNSLGAIVYSVPLAPCESVNIAVLEATRTDSIQRADDVLARESLLHDLTRDRSINESVNTALSETQRRFGLMGGARLPILSAILGASYSTADNTRDLSAGSLSTLHDAVSQATNAVRELQATVVMQASTAESHRITTRTLTNHNHCHALTIQFYEVLRQYLLTTSQTRVRVGVGIPLPTAALTTSDPSSSYVPTPTDTDLRFLEKYRTILAPDLLDETLAPGFDAARRLLFRAEPGESAGVPPASANPPAPDYVFDEFRVSVKRGQYGAWPGTFPSKRDGWLLLSVELADGTFVPFTVPWTSATYGTQPAAFSIDPPGIESNYEVAEREQWLPEVTAVASTPVRRSTIRTIRLLWRIEGGPKGFSLMGVRINAPHDGQLDEVFNASDDVPGPYANLFGVIGENAQVEFSVPSADAPASVTSTETPTQETVDDTRLAVELITHIKSWSAHYSNKIWADASASEWTTLLGTGLTPQALQHTERYPVCLAGEHAIFLTDLAPPAAATRVDAGVSIVSLPTRGLLGEAQLGHCSACEKRDVTRFWDWRESPCAETPPQIQGVTPSFFGQPPTLVPVGLPPSVVQIQQPPSEPDPSGLARALTAITQQGFGNMAQDPALAALVTGLASGTLSPAAARTLAQSVAAGSQTGGGALPSSGVAPHPRPSDQYDQLQVIQAAREANLVTDADARTAARNTLNGQSGGAVELTGAGPGVAGGVGGALVDAMGGIAGAVVAPVIHQLLDVPELQVDDMTKGAILLSDVYKDPDRYHPRGLESQSTAAAMVRFDDVGGSGPGSGLQGYLDLSWIDWCVLDEGALTAADKADPLRSVALRRILCKKEVSAIPQVKVGEAVKAAQVKLALVKGSFDPHAPLSAFAPPVMPGFIRITISVQPKTVMGQTMVGTVVIPLQLDSYNLAPAILEPAIWNVADAPDVGISATRLNPPPTTIYGPFT
jgi:hypothetical protein